ncbi:hypothetical protein TSUD_94650 [Trifolium subterraneum]|uniref:Reverse transcriptase domain-containing protein n=1 Tax=Trifolium subterraneum TaxID=3900 RepID=A0A2Z6NUS9_TRISU|nr:hypothetical protein TSUD_94650 [Trifolium subterraneum]
MIKLALKEWHVTHSQNLPATKVRDHGINFGFIKDFWLEMQADIMRFMAEFHRNGRLSKGINSTFIALIPKVDSPHRLNDFRPISLVGSLYKILAKVLANRLRMVVGRVISESQTAFVKDRQILDGILIANEVVDEARKTKKELLLFKVDFEKAYDSVDWGYLDAVMGRMSFPVLWRKWIKECVCTATASVLVNGSPTDEFPLKRGLRQRDPLSPLLFLVFAEGLHVLMQAMVENHFFSGYSVGMQNSVSVSHLQFADDTLLLGTKSWANVRAMRETLVLFETMSSLKVNFSKSMLVGVNISDTWLHAAATALRCKVGKIPFIYLGLPIGGDPRRLIFWEPVLNRIRSRLGIVVQGVGCTLWDRERAFARRGRSMSSWWREIARIRDEVADIGGGWFGASVVRKDRSVDMWLWRPDPIRGYSVREAYRFLTSHQPISMIDADDLIWHKQVPLKVSSFAWRLLRNRLPTKDNLANRGIITAEAQSCVAGCGALESAQHLFISCSTFGSLWLLEVYEHVAHSCSLLGSYASGPFGKKEITGYSEIPNSPYLS